MILPGDRVKFINEPLEGLVTSIINKDTIGVTVDGDFEIPVLITQVIKVGAIDEKLAETEAKPAPPEQFREKGLYLFFEPLANQKMSVGLFNGLEHPVVFSLLFRQKHEYLGVQHGLVAPGTIFSLPQVSLQQFEQWPEYVIQVLHHPRGNKNLLPPVVHIQRFKASAFYEAVKEVSFIPGRKVHVFPMIEDEPAPNLQKLKNHDFTAEQEEQPVVRKVTPPKDAVDLHIEQLTTDHRRMKPSDILSLQLLHAVKSIDEAYAAGKSSLVLIHGVGEGILKKELLKVLSRHEVVKYCKPADPFKYGSGAVEAFLK